MSKELPLWNEEETDVLPGNFLDFGRVLFGQRVSPEEIVSLLKLELTNVRKDFILPKTKDGYTYCDKASEHLILVHQKSSSYLFADRKRFFDNTAWIEASRKMLVTVATRLDADSFHYRAFDKKKLLGSFARNGKKLETLEGGQISVFLAGEEIYNSDKKFSKGVTEELIQFLERDCYPYIDGNDIKVRCFNDEIDIGNPEIEHLVAVPKRGVFQKLFGT